VIVPQALTLFYIVQCNGCTGSKSIKTVQVMVPQALIVSGAYPLKAPAGTVAMGLLAAVAGKGELAAAVAAATVTTTAAAAG
jgi:hypothetical protein